MSPADPISTAVDAAPADPRAVIERQLQVLTRLAEIGLEIAEAAGRRARASLDDDASPATDPGLAYARAARAVRMTIALQSRLLKDLAALDRTDALAQSARVNARKQRIHRLVERAIEAEHEDDEDEAEQLSEDAWERLRDVDDCAALLDRPIAETAARICKDLGLSPDWSAWAAEGLAEGGAGPPAPADEPDPPRLSPAQCLRGPPGSFETPAFAGSSG